MIDRRALLRGSFAAGGLLFSRFDKLRWPHPVQDSAFDSLRGGRQLGVVPFSDEGNAPMGEAIGAELDGRLFADLSKLTPGNPVTPNGGFYIRTRVSKLLSSSSWSIHVGGLIEKPFHISADDLEAMAQPMGKHAMECAGNSRSAHYGMLSLAEWTGVTFEKIVEQVPCKSASARVLISGFDEYAAESRSSVPGASWIFTPEQLKLSRAFLATKMNGQPLAADHGAPVRLMVPGWYGCVCIKWVNEIAFVPEDTPATSQMQEYAGRTMQTGIPRLAKDYQPATMDTAAMPVRVEKWQVAGKIIFRVVGILWGGSPPINGLEIQFNAGENYLPVEDVLISPNDGLSFWSQSWTPQRVGRYVMRLRLKGAGNLTRRLDSGYYMRSVEITEI